MQFFITDSTWDDREVRRAAARYALAEMTRIAQPWAWIVDDTGFLKQGTHSVGVQRQYTGSAGKACSRSGVSIWPSDCAAERAQRTVDRDRQRVGIDVLNVAAHQLEIQHGGMVRLARTTELIIACRIWCHSTSWSASRLAATSRHW